MTRARRDGLHGSTTQRRRFALSQQVPAVGLRRRVYPFCSVKKRTSSKFRESGLEVVKHEVIPGSVDNRFQATYLPILLDMSRRTGVLMLHSPSCIFASLTMISAAKSTSSSVVSGPTLNLSVPIAYSGCTFMAFSIAEYDLWLEDEWHAEPALLQQHSQYWPITLHCAPLAVLQIGCWATVALDLTVRWSELL